MVQTWHSGKGENFACPHCGALYSVIVHRFPTRDHDKATCKVCKEVMDEWNDTEAPSYTLIEKPEGA